MSKAEKIPFIFDEVKSGEWVQPRRRNYYMKCCDCGIVHRMNFRLIKDKIGRATIQMQAFRVATNDKPFAVYEALQKKYFKQLDRYDNLWKKYYTLKNERRQ